MLLGEAESGCVSLLDVLGDLDAVELNVAVAGEVGADATVGTVGSAAARDGSLNNDVADNAVVNVQLLRLSVGTEVDQKLTNALDGLLGPATLASLESLALSVTADTTVVASERNDLSVLENVVHVLDRLLQFPALDAASHIVSVLVVGAKVTNSALRRYKNEKRTESETDDPRCAHRRYRQ